MRVDIYLRLDAFELSGMSFNCMGRVRQKAGPITSEKFFSAFFLRLLGRCKRISDTVIFREAVLF